MWRRTKYAKDSRTGFVNGEGPNRWLTYVCCMSLTDQVFPLCSVNVFTEMQILSRQKAHLRDYIPTPYTKSFSVQKGIATELELTQSVMTRES